jgi:hypothetical protein
MLQIDSILSCISIRYNLADLGSATHLSNKKWVLESLIFQKMRKMGFRCVLIIRKKHIFKKWVADPSRRRQQSRTCKLNLGKQRIHSDLAQELQILQHVLRKI